MQILLDYLFALWWSLAGWAFLLALFAISVVSSVIVVYTIQYAVDYIVRYVKYV